MPHTPGHGHNPGQRFYNQPGQGQAGIQTEETSMVGADGWSNTATPGAPTNIAQQATEQAWWDQLAMSNLDFGVNTNPGGLDYSNPGEIPTGSHPGWWYSHPGEQTEWVDPNIYFGMWGNPWGGNITLPDTTFGQGASAYLDWLVNNFGGEYSDYWTNEDAFINEPYAQGWHQNWWFHQALESDPGWANQFMTGIDDQGNPIWDQQGISDAWVQANYTSGAFNPVVGGYTQMSDPWADFGSFNFQQDTNPNLGGASWGSFTPQSPGGTPPPTPGGAPTPPQMQPQQGKYFPTKTSAQPTTGGVGQGGVGSISTQNTPPGPTPMPNFNPRNTPEQNVISGELGQMTSPQKKRKNTMGSIGMY